MIQLRDAQGNWLYPRALSVSANTLSINGDVQTVAQWCFNHYRFGEILAARIDHSDYVEPFKYASFTILYSLSSTNYGWIVAFSDSSSNPMAFAQIINGIVYGWYPATYDECRTSQTSFKAADGTTDTRFYAGVLDAFHQAVQDGTYTGAGVTQISTTGPMYGILYQVLSKNYYSGKLFSYYGDFQSGFTDVSFSYANGNFRLRLHKGG